MNFLTNTVFPRIPFRNTFYMSPRWRGEQNSAIYFPIYEVFTNPSVFSFSWHSHFWGRAGSVDYEFRTSPEHSLAFLKLRFPAPFPNQLVYPLTVSHFLLIFQKSVDFICSLVNPFLFFLNCGFIPFCFSMKGQKLVCHLESYILPGYRLSLVWLPHKNSLTLLLWLSWCFNSLASGLNKFSCLVAFIHSDLHGAFWCSITLT